MRSVESWLPRALVAIGVPVAFAIFRRLAPPRPVTPRQPQKLTPLPTGVSWLTMGGIAACMLGTFFLFRGANHLWALLDGPALIRTYETQVVWFIFPFFAAICVPWPLTIWLLRRMGRYDEADAIEDTSNEQAGMDSYRVLKWMCQGIALPIGFFTLLAIPIHMSVNSSEARVGHYAAFRPEVFRFSDANRARLIATEKDSNDKRGRGQDLVIEFRDGRRLNASVGADGGAGADPEVIRILLNRTGLTPVTENGLRVMQ